MLTPTAATQFGGVFDVAIDRLVASVELQNECSLSYTVTLRYPNRIYRHPATLFTLTNYT